MSQCVLLTGATGFVGRQVLTALLNSGARLRVVVRQGKESTLTRDQGIESLLVTRDIFAEPEAWWRKALDGVQTVVHCAWYAEPGQYLQSPLNLHCLDGTLRLGLAASQSGVKRFVGVGTCFEYDVDAGLLHVTTPLRPRSLYASTKAAAFMTLEQLFLQSGTEFAWCRLFYLHGEGEDDRRLVPYVHSRIQAGKAVDLTDGTQVRDYLNVIEAGREIAESALGRAVGPINVCSGNAITVRQFVEEIADKYGRKDLLHFGVRPVNPFDPPYVVGVKQGNFL